ncbi:amidohydrolase [Mycetocola sp. BIGb0189]|uniref:amidohydrolase n=1 Tax=Mycetocola sp. BIGb0189 TaxID=2940604 RepID=UPI00216A13A5|nr:amidohydrolase [Mycetocola sp. BIGb0189]MCS4275109.1 amidohydrolase [Mycetocola sp. BIGb0189]
MTTDPLDTYLAYGQRSLTPAPIGEAESAFAGAPADIHARIAARIEGLRPRLHEFAVDLYHHPELGFEEHRSVQKIAELLAEEGVETEVGVFGLPTAFVAHAGSEVGDGPHFAVIAEYDALPGVGHACGHNVIAGIAIGAFLALRDVVAETGGRVSLIGTPAEEGGGGKELIIRAGGFDDVDAAGMVHPSVGHEVSPIYGSGTTGVRRIRVAYHGRAAHAAGTPYLGLNALDAVVTAYQGIAQLRQHILPIDRIHGVITNGGSAANVVPELTEAHILVRSSEIDTLKILTQRVVDILEAAALATGTRAEIDLDAEPAYLPLANNIALTKHWARHLTDRGRTVPLKPKVVRQGGPSTDMGNVSQYVPAIHPALGLGGDGTIVPHNAGFADISILPDALNALVDAATALGSAAADYLVDADLRTAVADEFVARGGRVRWED